MTFITTYTGRRFYPLDPQPSDVCIEDIAHAISRVCRFNGHINAEWYSVAEHSVLGSYVVPKFEALAFLLHDSTEAYIADVSRPVKHTPEMAAYRSAETRLANTIAPVFGLERDAFFSPYVAATDQAMLALEARSLLPYDPWMDELPEPAKVELGLWGPSEAERMFLERYYDLTK